MDIYRWLYTRIGGRPWTHISIDVWRKYEWIPQMLWLFTGILIYKYFGWFGVIFFCCAYTYGYINGHFFWPHKYNPPFDEDMEGFEK